MKKQLFIGVISTLVIAIMGLLFTRYYVNEFGKSQYGLISLVLALVSAILNLDGLQKPLVVEYSRDRDNNRDISETVKMAMTFSLLIGLVSVGIFFAILYGIDIKIENVWIRCIFLGAGGFIFFFFASSPHNAYLVSINRAHLNQVWKFVVYSTLFLSLYGISQFYGNVPEIFFGLAVSGVIGFIFVSYLTKQPIIPHRNILEAITRFVRVFIMGIIINVSIFLFLVLDKMFLGDVTATVRADYMIPYELVTKFLILHGIVGSILLGRLSSVGNRNMEDFGVRYYYYSIIYIGFIGLVSLNLLLYGRSFFDLWLSGEVTEQMMSVYSVLVIMFFFNSFGWLGFNVLLMTGRLSQVAKLYALMPLILIVGCFCLSDYLGIYGIAISVVAARLIDVVLFVVSTSSHISQLTTAAKKLSLTMMLYVPILLLTIMAKMIIDAKLTVGSLGTFISGLIVCLFLMSLLLIVNKRRAC